MSCQAHTIRILRTVVLTLLGGMAGCSTWFSGNFKDPKVELTKVDIIKARLLEQQFMLRFRIDNPNDRSLPVRGLIYTVHLNDVELASGESSGWLTVPPTASNITKCRCIPTCGGMKYIVRLLEKPDRPINYRLAGELKTGLMAGRRVHISSNGEIIPGNFIPE